MGPPMPPSIRHSERATPTTCCWCPNEAGGSIREFLEESLRGGRGADLCAIDEIYEAIVPALGRLSAKALCPAVARVGRVGGGVVLGAPAPAGAEEDGG